MCNGWTRTIIHTLANTANISKTMAKTISSSAFCLLANIPDVSLHMQTLRITEFFLLINSNNCQSGKTALARLCALRHKTPKQIREVIQKLFDKDITINHRKNNRLGDTIKWMKKLTLVIRENTEDKSDIQTQIQNLSQVLQIKTTPNQHIIAYTETRKRKSKNSGYDI